MNLKYIILFFQLACLPIVKYMIDGTIANTRRVGSAIGWIAEGTGWIAKGTFNNGKNLLGFGRSSADTAASTAAVSAASKIEKDAAAAAAAAAASEIDTKEVNLKMKHYLAIAGGTSAAAIGSGLLYDRFHKKDSSDLSSE